MIAVTAVTAVAAMVVCVSILQLVLATRILGGSSMLWLRPSAVPSLSNGVVACRFAPLVAGRRHWEGRLRTQQAGFAPPTQVRSESGWRNSFGFEGGQVVMTIRHGCRSAGAALRGQWGNGLAGPAGPPNNHYPKRLEPGRELMTIAWNWRRQSYTRALRSHCCTAHHEPTGCNESKTPTGDSCRACLSSFQVSPPKSLMWLAMRRAWTRHASDFELGLVHLTGLGGGRAAAHGNMHVACDDGLACLRALSSDHGAQTQPWPFMDRKACLLDLDFGGSTRIALVAMLSQSQGGVRAGWFWSNGPIWRHLFVITVLQYPHHPWSGN
jgi:hypothetical protein